MTKIKHSYSSLSEWRRCRYRFWLKRKKGIIPEPGIGLIRGSAGHAALEYWYGTERNREKAIEVASNTYTSVNQTDWELLRSVLLRYFDWSEANDNFEVIATEWNFELELGPHTFIGFIDGIVKDFRGQIWLLEHKFMKQVSTKHIPLDPQISVYLLAAVASDLKPTGVMYNNIRVSNGATAIKEPVVRTLAYRPIEGLQYFAQELVAQMREVERFMSKDQPIAPYRNLTKDCSWDCSYKDICLVLTDTGNADYMLEE